MEALKFVAVLLLVVVVQVFGALGISSDEEDGEVLMVENWQVKRKCSQKRVLRWIPVCLLLLFFSFFLLNNLP